MVIGLRLAQLKAELQPGSHRRLRNAQTQELEELTVENGQMADQLRALEDENTGLKKLLEKQGQELKSMAQEKKVVEEDRSQKGKMSLGPLE